MTGKVDENQALRERGFTEEQIKAVMGSKSVPVIEACGLLFKAPLSNFKYTQMDYVLHLHSQFEKGNLPFPGPVSEQPGQIMEILSLVSVIKSEIQIQQQKKQVNNG